MGNCDLYLGFVGLFAHDNLFVVCLGGHQSVHELGAYCLGHIVEGKYLAGICLVIYLEAKNGLLPMGDQNVCLAPVWGQKMSLAGP